MNQKQPPRRSAKDVGKDMPAYDLDMDYSDTWMAIDQFTDCLDPIKHQGISILFSNTCHEGQKHQRPCLPPCIIPMFYYGQNDIAVGDFLQRYCFKDYYKCPICSVDMAKHVRHIIHGCHSIHIEIRSTSGGSPSKDENIYTWLECLKCHHATPFTVMSANSLIFSFAKFLEIKFYSDSYVTRSHGDDMRCSCSHRLHPDYSQCFKYKNKLATFRPSTIDILEVLLPPTQVAITTPSNKYLLDYANDIKHIGRIVEGVFCRIKQKLDKYRLEPVASLIDDRISNSRGERDAMRTKVKHLKELMVQEGFVEIKVGVMLGVVTKEENMTSIQDRLEDLKRSITEVVECWNIDFEELDCRVRDYRRKIREGVVGGDVATVTENWNRSPRESPVAISQVTSQTSANIPVNPSPVEAPAVSPSETTPNSSPCTPSPHTTVNRSPRASDKKYPNTANMPVSEITILMSRRLTHERNLSDGGVAVGGANGKMASLEVKEKKQHRRNLSDPHSATSEVGVYQELDYTLSPASSGRMPSTDTLLTPDSISPSHRAEPEEDLDVGDEQREDKLPTADVPPPVTRDQPPSSSSTPAPQDRIGGPHEGDSTFVDTSTGFLSKFRPKEQEWRDDPTKYYLLDPSLMIAGGQSSPSLSAASGGFSRSGSAKATPNNSGNEPQGGGVARGAGLKKRKSVANIGGHTADGDAGKSEKKSSKDKERLSILSRPFQRLPPPLEFNEHHTMPSHTDFPIAMYEKEPTSIIAYALSTRHYAAELKLLREKKAVLTTAATSVPGLPESRSATSFSSPKLKRYFSETDRPGQTVTTTINGGPAGGANSSKGLFRKKSGNMTLFSGLTTSASNHGGDMIDPFEQSCEVSPRKMDTTSSSSGHSTRSGDLGSEVVSSSTTAASGLPPAGGGGGSGGTDELDQGGKSRGHISLEFSNSDKTANFFCKVYFAEEFRQLRERIFPAGEDKFIRSLTRCVKFEAKGGKSRSAFCKVADDRFILKQVKSIEISAFEDFAPRYLDYINKALEEKRPLALAKIFGAYSIGFKNSKTGSSKRMDVIVMENLLYEHSITRVFDLKGSMRSRYVDPSKDSSSDVLLDENYLNSICHAPVYVHPHSKFVLMQALMADSEFLAQNSIMDYSLLTCIDDNTGLLVVGIIDYVRTFTFDKRLEMYLKKTSGRELPTVVYPELYRKRFCEAMERYFTVVPDKWSGLGMDF